MIPPASLFLLLAQQDEPVIAVQQEGSGAAVQAG